MPISMLNGEQKIHFNLAVESATVHGEITIQ